MENHFINGKTSAPANGQYIRVYSPIDGTVLAEVARGNHADIQHAINSAKYALLNTWGHKSALERGRILTQIGLLTRSSLEVLAKGEADDTGKPIALARKDIEALARYFEFYGGATDKIHGEVIPYLEDHSVSVINEPFGIVGHIIPWNYPAQMLGRTIAPALAMGNVSIVKPSEEACLTSLKFAELAIEAGLPPGALNIVTGYGHEAAHSLCSHPELNMVTFTGSPQVGVQIQTEAAKNHIKCVLELGGKSPQIIFEDADLDRAVLSVVNGIIQNAGQTCSASSRVLVQRSISQKVQSLLKERFNNLKAGPSETSSDCGPIITRKQYDFVKKAIMDSKGKGVPVIGEGSIDDISCVSGNFVAPIIFGPVSETEFLAKEEIFGPVLALLEFDDENEAAAIANNTDYGLVAAVWTENGARQHRMAMKIKSGQVFINCFGAGGGVELPFGGVKKSGHGREKGIAALKEFCTTKTIINHYK